MNNDDELFCAETAAAAANVAAAAVQLQHEVVLVEEGGSAGYTIGSTMNIHSMLRRLLRRWASVTLPWKPRSEAAYLS